MAKTRHKKRVSSSVAKRRKREQKRKPSATIARQKKVDAAQGKLPSTAPTRTVRATNILRGAGSVSRVNFDVQVTEVTSMRGRIHPMAQQPFDQPTSVQDEFVASTAIKSYSYSTARRILIIRFVSGGSKTYLGVPKGVVRGLNVAQSKGRYFHRMIYGTWSGPKGKKKYTPRYREV